MSTPTAASYNKFPMDATFPLSATSPPDLLQTGYAVNNASLPSAYAVKWVKPSLTSA
ncbi:hypothetical protein [Xylella fastidiosa]|uniref:hypothetical protein n=1 Tax=Xylella fastidiosa TaxID=2371 RepID=UPI001F258DE0|nr:hypothetical protein [Xylella fastidiosa]